VTNVRTIGLRDLIAMICMAVVCLSPLRAVSIANSDLEHALELAHAADVGGVVHYCDVAPTCEREPAHEESGGVSHHHHGDTASGCVAVSSVAPAGPLSVNATGWSTPAAMGRGLGQIAPERPPKA